MDTDQRKQQQQQQFDELDYFRNINHQATSVFTYGNRPSGYEVSNYRDPITSLLSKLQSPSVISGQKEVYSDQKLLVDGTQCGSLFNLNVDELIKKANPAPFGKGDKTVYDDKIRKGLQIEADRIEFRISLPVSQLSGIATRGFIIVPKLYKIHIYQEGGFFEEHTDTPHGPNHIGTLIIPLGINLYSGGDLVVKPIGGEENKQERFHLDNESNKYSWVAFYNDCSHKVLPVEKGTRIVAQYDIFQYPILQKHKEDSEKFEEEREYGEDEPLDDDVDVHEYLEDSLIYECTKPFKGWKSKSDSESRNLLIINELIEELKKKKDDRKDACLILQHRYKCKVDPENLKGVDALLWRELKKSFQVSISSFLIAFSNSPDSKKLVDLEINRFKPLEEIASSGYEQLIHSDYQDYTGNESCPEQDVGMVTGLLIHLRPQDSSHKKSKSKHSSSPTKGFIVGHK
eukprot:gene7763-9554_t